MGVTVASNDSSKIDKNFELEDHIFEKKFYAEQLAV